MKKFPAFHKTKGLLLCSHKHTASLYPEPDERTNFSILDLFSRVRSEIAQSIEPKSLSASIHDASSETLWFLRPFKDFQQTMYGVQNRVISDFMQWPKTREDQKNSVHTAKPSFPKFHLISFHLHLGFPCSLFPSGFWTKFFMHVCLPHACYISYPSSPPWFHRSNISWGIQIMELTIMHFPSVSSHFIAPRYKYSPKHPVYKHPQSMFFLI